MGNKESTKRSPTDTRDRFGSDYVRLSRIGFEGFSKIDEYVRRIPRTDKLMVKGFFSASEPDSIFSDLAEKYKDAAKFVRMNVVEMAQFGVQTTPTFILEKYGQEVDRLVGGDWKELESRIEKLILMKLGPRGGTSLLYDPKTQPE